MSDGEIETGKQTVTQTVRHSQRHKNTEQGRKAYLRLEVMEA